MCLVAEDFKNLVVQPLGRERLLKEGHVVRHHTVPQDRIVGVAGHVDALLYAAHPGEHLRHLGSAHARHHHVAQEHVDRTGVPLGTPPGLLAARAVSTA